MRSLPDIDTRYTRDVEWATVPLKDPSNVGKWVWHSWNSNRANAVPIIAVTRVGVRIDNSKTGFKETEPGYAARNGKWHECVFARSLVAESAEHDALAEKLRRMNWYAFTTEQLRTFIAAVEETQT